ncbi:hypothetical protein KSC_036050 [Ktedonobacter sp. SOSP1-52]|nr:hypothetical protein KSC_036050 [Ktedonobacter sp. SOSP1-52]
MRILRHLRGRIESKVKDACIAESGFSLYTMRVMSQMLCFVKKTFCIDNFQYSWQSVGQRQGYLSWKARPGLNAHVSRMA